MNTSLVAGNLTGFTLEQLGTTKTAAASLSGEWRSAKTTIAPRQHDADDSLISAWVMIGTILSCLAIMIAIVIVASISAS